MRLLRAVIGVLTLALLSTLLACATDDDGPRGVADRFLHDFSARDYAAAAKLTTDPARAESALASAWSGLDAESMSARAGRVRLDRDIADVDVTYTWKLPGRREWSYPATLTMGRSDTGWAVRWASTDIHPELGADQRLSLATFAPPRAAVNESDGSEVMGTGTVVAISFDAKPRACLRSPCGPSVTMTLPSPRRSTALRCQNPRPEHRLAFSCRVMRCTSAAASLCLP